MNREMTQYERISWFYLNYYETGMEFIGVQESLKDTDLDNFEWYGEKIEIPKHFNYE